MLGCWAWSRGRDRETRERQAAHGFAFEVMFADEPILPEERMGNSRRVEQVAKSYSTETVDVDPAHGEILARGLTMPAGG